MNRKLFVAASALGFLGVALGAFGAHGLKEFFGGLDDGEARLAWWRTAVEYQMWHALLAFGIALHPWCARKLVRAAGAAAIIGVGLFSGSLYVMALTGVKVLGAITPLGGLCFLAAWGLVVVEALRDRRAEA